MWAYNSYHLCSEILPVHYFDWSSQSYKYAKRFRLKETSSSFDCLYIRVSSHNLHITVGCLTFPYALAVLHSQFLSALTYFPHFSPPSRVLLSWYLSVYISGLCLTFCHVPYHVILLSDPIFQIRTVNDINKIPRASGRAPPLLRF